MKARLAPIYFDPGRDEDFDKQLSQLQTLLKDEADFLDPIPLGSQVTGADAALLPQLLGQVYREPHLFQSMELPVLVATSEFGMLNMWDWEIVSYLRSKGVNLLAPYQLEQTKNICRGLGVKRELQERKFLLFQDKPGNGFQGDIFKRFFWWEDECVQGLIAKFGITLVKKSFKEMGAAARAIRDEEADAVLAEWDLATEDISKKQLGSAVKVYMRLKEELAKDEKIGAIGINCLNESHHSDTTPCLAWNMLYQEDKLIWGCEGDIMSMMTKYILHRSLDVPIMMTNIYPFLMGQAALKHERISHFPVVEEPENHILVAHCGYLGVLPSVFSTEWTLRPKVLAIVDENATAIDARLPVGDITLAKLHSSLQKITVAEGALVGYAQYPNSDCLNGGIIKIRDGRALVESVSSHHYLLMTGHNLTDIKNLAKIFDLEVEII